MNYVEVWNADLLTDQLLWISPSFLRVFESALITKSNYSRGEVSEINYTTNFYLHCAILVAISVIAKWERPYFKKRASGSLFFVRMIF